MNLSLEWARDYVNLDGITPKEYCDRLTATGSKVEGYEILGEDIENVVAGKVLSLERHPDSDHLWVCQIDIGEEAPVQIVTGAQNVFAGAMVPVAKAPSKLPGGIAIKAGKLRGVPSNGMLCSIGELNLTTHDMPGTIEDGIFIKEGFDCKPGDDIHDVLKLSDTVVEFEITSNRPDCLSVIGLARETAVSFDRDFCPKTPAVTFAKDGDKIENYLSVDVQDAVLCPRYTARVVKNVKIAPSPLWLRMRLRASGVRPINNIVDITNYVMLEYGQPMHAFDYTCLDGSKIIVRRAADGENFKSLDDIDHTLNNTNLVIADEKKAVALAGVMGGANSEIKDDTVTVVFESANFLGSSVRVTAKSQGMRTESSGRFEKGLDPENTMPALDRACELVTLLGAGDVVDCTIDVYKG
ncbi:MAG: phenylalanine--tRNA ligase subunit beta [Clostridia bacterium]|nr:phenylalanine--tRNA ligase subunit beta [Clostridia bacterium]